MFFRKMIVNIASLQPSEKQGLDFCPAAGQLPAVSPVFS